MREAGALSGGSRPLFVFACRKGEVFAVFRGKMLHARIAHLFGDLRHGHPALQQHVGGGHPRLRFLLRKSRAVSLFEHALRLARAQPDAAGKRLQRDFAVSVQKRLFDAQIQLGRGRRFFPLGRGGARLFHAHEQAEQAHDRARRRASVSREPPRQFLGDRLCEREKFRVRLSEKEGAGQKAFCRRAFPAQALRGRVQAQFAHGSLGERALLVFRASRGEIDVPRREGVFRLLRAHAPLAREHDVQFEAVRRMAVHGDSRADVFVRYAYGTDGKSFPYKGLVLKLIDHTAIVLRLRQNVKSYDNATFL